MRYTHPVTPTQTDSSHIKLIREHLRITVEPLYVECRPLQDSLANECFETVEAHVAIEGGARILGWAIWELPGLYVEAEFHAVWRTPSGELVDISPKNEPTRSILFLPDSSASYEGHQVNNIRVPVRYEPSVLALFQACEREFELLNKGDRRGRHGEFSLSGADAIEYERIVEEKMLASIELSTIRPEVGPYTPCPCGSGKKTKWCCKIVK